MTTKTTGQRTPGPWSYTGTSDWATVFRSGTNEHICGIISKEKKANAAFIVRACNSHDALVSALQSLFEHCAMVHKYWGDGSNTKEADAAIESARAAIKSATGQG